MKLTIVAATGGIGRQVLEQAVAAGHDSREAGGRQLEPDRCDDERIRAINVLNYLGLRWRSWSTRSKAHAEIVLGSAASCGVRFDCRLKTSGDRGIGVGG